MEIQTISFGFLLGLDLELGFFEFLALGLMSVFFGSLSLDYGYGLKTQTQTQTQRSKKTVKIFEKYMAFQKKSEKIFSFKYLNLNKIFLVFGFGFGACFWGGLGL